MRWNEFFEDLETQLDQELASEEQNRLIVEARLAQARLTLREQLRELSQLELPFHKRTELELSLKSGELLRIRVANIGKDWILAELPRQLNSPSTIIPLSALALIRSPSSTQSEAKFDSVTLRSKTTQTVDPSDRITFSYMLRDLARRRKYCSIVLGAERRLGTITQVSSDFIILTEHDRDLFLGDFAKANQLVIPIERIQQLIIQG